MTPLYSAEAPAPSRPPVLSGLAPDLRRDPREALRDMRLRGRAREIVMARVDGQAPLQDDRLEDPYGDSPADAGRDYSLLRRPEGDIVLLQSPDWSANNGGLVGALDETRYAFRGKVVRVVSEGVDAPSLGLKRLLRNWQAQEQIDAAFVEWRYVDEMGSQKHQVEDVLQFPAAAAARPATAPAPKAALPSPRVFVSYAHLDRDWHDRLMQMLAPLKTKYPQAIWHDVLLQPGVDWFNSIGSNLDAARIIVLLVTPAFLDSHFILEHELGPTLKAVEAGEKTLLWIYVKFCKYGDAGIGKYQAAHDITKPLEALSDADRGAQLLVVYDALSTALSKLPASV